MYMGNFKSLTTFGILFILIEEGLFTHSSQARSIKVGVSWEREECLSLYRPSPLGVKDGIPVTKIDWDSASILEMDQNIIESVLDVWPEPYGKRKTTKEYLSVLGHPRPTLSNENGLSYRPLSEVSSTSSSRNDNRNINDTSFYVWHKHVGATRPIIHFENKPGELFQYGNYVILHENKRVIYISNLKSGSSTINNLLLKLDKTKVLKTCGAYKPTLLRDLFDRISMKECENNCTLSCDGLLYEQDYLLNQDNENHMQESSSTSDESPSSLWKNRKQSHLQSTDLPDELFDRYLVFSFVRDPMTRPASTYHQISGGRQGDSFAQHLRGQTPFSTNVHYNGQAHQILASQTRSGTRIKLHFVGKLEDFDYDWSRLQYALTDEAVKLSPAERVALIPPQRKVHAMNHLFSNNTLSPPHDIKDASLDVKNIKIERKGEEQSNRYQPIGSGPPSLLSRPVPFTIEQELEICRRYLQDFICFDYLIPSSCVKYAKEVY